MSDIKISKQITGNENIVGSVVNDFINQGYDEENYVTEEYIDQSINDEYPRILLMGLRRSGKSSIQKVVFHKMSPTETLFLESTNKIEKTDVSDCSFIKFHIWDCPGQFDYIDPIINSDNMFSSSRAVIFVIDAQDDYTDALSRLNNTILCAFRVNKNIKFEVFIHKVDSLNDDQKIDIQREIAQKSNDDLIDGGLESVSIGYHLTTIYDHSIFEAFSKVVQKLIPYLEVFENILNLFIINSNLEKAFLFDVASKIYLATDSMVMIDMQTYELCCDMIDVVVDIASIYNPKHQHSEAIFSESTSSTIKLNNENVLYLRGVNKYLALVCLMREEALEKLGIIEYNFDVLKNGIQNILKLKQIEGENFNDDHKKSSNTSLLENSLLQ